MAECGKKTLRILCIHGYMQSGDTFRQRTGAFRKLIKKQAELVFVTAPNEVKHPPSQADDNVEVTPGQRGWWFSREDDYFNARNASDCTKGYDQSLEVVKKAFAEEGPFDGLLGFSQGATLVSLLCGQLQLQGSACPFQFDFAIMVASFKSRSSPHDYLYSQPITMPTLHVLGESDKVIPKEMSEDLLQYFVQPEVLLHDGGHFIPASSAHKKVYLGFLDKMIARKTEKQTVAT